MAVLSEDATSLTSYVELVLRLLADWSGKNSAPPEVAELKPTEAWFRGNSRLSHQLVPSAYRGNRDHLSMYNRFIAAGAGVIAPPPVTDWDWYFAAQHYELPTRLLDWTVDPLVALYFAIRGMRDDDEDLDIDERDPPVVWMMDGGSLNFLAYGIDEIIIPYDDGAFSRYWRPGLMAADPTSFLFQGNAFSNEKPIAVWPTRSTPRIMAQNGCFTVHGTRREPLESVFAAATGDHANKLVRIIISDPSRVDAELSDMGVCKLRFFPELQNVSGRLRRLYSRK